jgi:hypothetical protein
MQILSEEALAERAAVAAPLHAYIDGGGRDRADVERMAGAIEQLLTLPEQHALCQLTEAYLDNPSHETATALRAWLSWL